MPKYSGETPIPVRRPSISTHKRDLAAAGENGVTILQHSFGICGENKIAFGL
jgi:hypothetical protein